METGDIARFASVGDFVSYCRLAPSVHLSNGKKKGEGNAKCGNRYLGWAFLEAGHKCRQYCEPAKRYFERKKRKRGTVIASKALAAKLARSVYVMLKHDCDFDVSRAFGPLAGTGKKAEVGVAAVTALV
jgi:transposase